MLLNSSDDIQLGKVVHHREYQLAKSTSPLEDRYLLTDRGWMGISNHKIV